MKISLLFSALFCSQLHAAFPLACNTVEATSLSQVTMITDTPQGTMYRYRIRVNINTLQATTAMGFEVSAPALASLATTYSFSSGPIMAPMGMDDTFITIAESSIPAPGTSFSPDNNGAIDITSSLFAETIVFSFCQPYQTSDLVFIAKAGRTYNMARSLDLNSWETVESISPNADTEIWRPQLMLQSVPAPMNEFYRVTADCTDQVDCNAEQARLQESVLFLRNKFESSAGGGIVPLPAPPINSASPRIVGIPRFGNMLSINPGAWSNTPDLTYQWKVNGSTITGQTAATFLVPNNIGDTITATETATNADGNASQTTPGVVIAGALPPSLVIYDKTNHIWVDNDDDTDVYLTEFVMSLASAGDIKLKGISTTTSTNTNGYNPLISDQLADSFASGRLLDVNLGLTAGFRNIPTPTPILKGNIARPSNGQIDSSIALNSLTGRAILAAANAAWQETGKPLVFVSGGSLTAVADAYLLDPTPAKDVKSKIIVAWLGANSADMRHYNSWSDGWAAYIALTKFDSVVFPLNIPTMEAMAPVALKSRILTDLPDSVLKGRLFAKQHPNGLPGGIDADSPPAVAIMAPDYVKAVTRMQVSGLEDYAEQGTFHKVPTLSVNASGKIRMVTAVNQSKGTNEWWRAMANADAYVLPHTKSITTDDNFNRANLSSLGAGWMAIGSFLRNEIVSNAGGKTAVGPGFDMRTEAHANNQYASLVFDSVGTNKFPGLTVRATASGGLLTGMMLVSVPGSGMLLQSWDNGVRNDLLYMPQAVAGDTWELRAIGANYSIWRMRVGQADFKLIGVHNSNAQTSGAVGMTNYNGSATPLITDNWKSGTISFAP